MCTCRPFQLPVQAGELASLVSAFIDLNGIPATANRRLLTDVLRGEWGFDGLRGLRLGDRSRNSSITALPKTSAEAARLAPRAGLDMDMVSGVYINTLGESTASGKNLHRRD